MNMQGKDLIQSLSKKTGLTQRQATEALQVILDEITKILSRGEEVKLTGFGKFLVKNQKPKFKPGAILKDAVK